MNEHDREDDELKKSEAESKPQRIRFIFGKGLTPEQMSDELDRSYREHFGIEPASEDAK